MVEEGRDGNGKGALIVGRKDQRWAPGFMKVVVVVCGGVAGDPITGAEDGVLGEEVARKFRVVAATAQVANISR